MTKNSTIYLLIIFLNSLIFGCEKDDICLVETPSSPRLIVRLFDKDDRTSFKSAENITIYGLGQKKALITLNTDSLTIPLKTQETFTQYAFILPSSTNILTVAPKPASVVVKYGATAKTPVVVLDAVTTHLASLPALSITTIV